MKTEEDIYLLNRISNHLLLNASYLSDIGLYNGRMGIVLFFAHYSKYTNQNYYDDFASILLDEIIEDLNYEKTYSFANGLSGIIWGVEYLYENSFIIGEPDFVLCNLYDRINEINIANVKDSSLDFGSLGLLCSLYKSNKRKGKSVIESDCYNSLLFASMNEKMLNDGQVLKYILHCDPTGDDLTSWNIGLRNGCAGYGLKLMNIIR